MHTLNSSKDNTLQRAYRIHPLLAPLRTPIDDVLASLPVSRTGSPAQFNTQYDIDFLKHFGDAKQLDEGFEQVFEPDLRAGSGSDTTVEEDAREGAGLMNITSFSRPFTPTIFGGSRRNSLDCEGASLTNTTSFMRPFTPTIFGGSGRNSLDCEGASLTNTHEHLDCVFDNCIFPNTSDGLSTAVQKDQGETSTTKGVSDARAGNETLSSNHRKHECDWEDENGKRCGETFTKETHLKQHGKTHGDDWRPIPCRNQSKGCDVRFSDTANMRKHLSISCQKTDEEVKKQAKFKCPEPECANKRAGKIGYCRKVSYDDHKHKKHPTAEEKKEGKKWHKCTKCKGEPDFQSASGLSRHIRNFHPDGNTVRNGRGTKRGKKMLCESSPTKKRKY